MRLVYTSFEIGPVENAEHDNAICVDQAMNHLCGGESVHRFRQYARWRPNYDGELAGRIAAMGFVVYVGCGE